MEDDFDDFDFKKIKFDFKNFKEGGISWWTRILLRFFPIIGIKRFAKELGMDFKLAEKANDLFSNVERVDVIPSSSGRRGFQIILNKSTALYFYQDGDHFTFDGYESGDYDGGNVTIFDDLEIKK